MSDHLNTGVSVRVLKHHPGRTGTIAHYSEPCGFYTVRLADGRHDGPYCRNELEPLTDPPPGSPSSPATGARDGALFAGGSL